MKNKYDLIIDISSLINGIHSYFSLNDSVIVLNRIVENIKALNIFNVIILLKEEQFNFVNEILGQNSEFIIKTVEFENKIDVIKSMSENLSDHIVVLFDGNIWVDFEIENIVKYHILNKNKVTCCPVQPGFQPVVFNKSEFMKLPSSFDNLVAFLSNKSKKDKNICLYHIKIANDMIYMNPDSYEGWEFLLKICKENLNRENWKIEDRYHKFKVANRRHIENTIKRLNCFYPLKNRKILEIGSSVQEVIGVKTIFEKYGAIHVTAVNIKPKKYSYSHPNFEFICKDVLELDFKDNTFDLIFSIAFWEHVHFPDKLFKMINKWLKIGGVHYGIFQVWSAFNGYHLPPHFVPEDLIEPFSHLKYNEDEFRTILEKKKFESDKILNILDRIYHSEYINRYDIRDFLKMIKDSKMEILHMDGRNHGHYHPSSASVSKKKSRLSKEELSINGLEFLLRKSKFNINEILNQY